MKNLIKGFMLILTVLLLTPAAAPAKVKQMKLRVLYLSGLSDWTHGEMGSNDHYKRVRRNMSRMSRTARQPSDSCSPPISPP